MAHLLHVLVIILALQGVLSAQQQRVAAPNAPVAAPGVRLVEPPPVMIGNRLESELTDEELQELFQEQVQPLVQEDNQIKILRIAPGQPVTLRFKEPIVDVINDAPDQVDVQLRGNFAVFTLLTAEVSSKIKLVFAGDLLRHYHVLPADNFLAGNSTFDVAPFTGVSLTGGQAVPPLSSAPYEEQVKAIRETLVLMRNYDALLAEKAITPQIIRRTPLFKESPTTGFTLYYAYQRPGVLAFSFSWKNLQPSFARKSEADLRLAIANSWFVPRFVYLHQRQLPPKGSTSGIAILLNPKFSLKQKLELTWK